MRTLGLLGGALDMTHYGHLAMAEHSLKYVDEVWIQPCWSHMHGKNMTEDQHRLNMLGLAIDSYMPESRRRGKLRISSYEMDHKLDMCSFDILNHMFRPPNADAGIHFCWDEVYVIIGQDNADQIQKWKKWEELIDTYKFIVFPREGFSNTEMLPAQDWYRKEPHFFAPDVIPDIASSRLREYFASWRRAAFLGEKCPNPWPKGGFTIEGWQREVEMCRTKLVEQQTPGVVLDYISEHNLYPNESSTPQKTGPASS
jgi:nicotinate-nucleotide adenylyltransferase